MKLVWIVLYLGDLVASVTARAACSFIKKGLKSCLGKGYSYLIYRRLHRVSTMVFVGIRVH